MNKLKQAINWDIAHTVDHSVDCHKLFSPIFVDHFLWIAFFQKKQTKIVFGLQFILSTREWIGFVFWLVRHVA